MLNIDTEKVFKTASEQLGVYEPKKAAARYQINKERIRDKYQFEKVIGRRTKTGVKKLKELRPIHQHIIAMYLQGMKCVEIAQQMGCSLATVHTVIHDPLAQGIIVAARDGYWQELEGMFPLVLDALRDGLQNGSIQLRLQAAAQWSKMTGNQQADTQVNIHMGVVQESREKLVSAIAEMKARLAEKGEKPRPEVEHSPALEIEGEIVG